MSTSFEDILGILKQDMLLRLNDMDTISNNLDNVNTVGFRGTRSNFQELLGTLLAKGGSRITSTQLNTTQGSITSTGNPLDLAIEGDGFFAVTMADGTTAYTRDGRFNVDSDNRLVNVSGQPVVWDGTIPTGLSDMKVDQDGVTWGQQGTDWIRLGQISLTRFTNPGALQMKGENLWVPTANSGAAITGIAGTGNFGKITSQSVEASNVDMGEEFTRLISLQRGMQVSVRALQMTDRMLQQAIAMKK
jgi:flagellar basal body rod protein FlgG